MLSKRVQRKQKKKEKHKSSRIKHRLAPIKIFEKVKVLAEEEIRSGTLGTMTDVIDDIVVLVREK